MRPRSIGARQCGFGAWPAQVGLVFLTLLGGACAKPAPAAKPGEPVLSAVLEQRFGRYAALWTSDCRLGPDESAMVLAPLADRDGLFVRLRVGPPRMEDHWDSGSGRVIRPALVVQATAISEAVIVDALGARSAAAAGTKPGPASDADIIAVLVRQRLFLSKASERDALVTFADSADPLAGTPDCDALARNGAAP